MRYIWVVLALVCASSIAGPTTARADEPPASFTFEGAGWGHGVGFSQWGGRGQAIDDPDKTGEDIVAHYYTDSTVQGLTELSLPNDYLDTVEFPFWVGLAQNVEILEFTPVGGPAEICMADGNGGCITPAAPAAGETWTFERISAGVCAWYKGGVQQGATGKCRGRISWPDATALQVRDLSHAEPICGSLTQLAACEYSSGVLKLRDDPVQVGFHVVLSTTIEDYLAGIRELPDDWDRIGVNEAQAIASRSYAAYEFFANEVGGRTEFDAGLSDAQKDACWCHTYDDTRDQFFVGRDRELAAPQWVDAVTATADRVLTYLESGYDSFTQAGILQAFYFASSGGWTESNTDGFGSSIQYPYLLPVQDSWAIDPEIGNPNDSWTSTVNASTIASLLGWDSVTTATLVNGPPGATVRFTGVDGGVEVSTTRRGVWLRSSLGLKSTVVYAIDGVTAGPPPVFSDIGGSVHEDNILAIYDAGITVGCATGLYCPSDDVTRAQMASFLARAMDLPAPSGDFFGDDGGSVHEDAINQLYEAGISFGCAERLYCPNDAITREQMAAFLARALNLTSSGGDPFTDDDGSPFEDEIAAIAEAGITLGCDTNLFCPDDPVTRAQMASFLVRAFLAES